MIKWIEKNIGTPLLLIIIIVLLVIIFMPEGKSYMTPDMDAYTNW